ALWFVQRDAPDPQARESQGTELSLAPDSSGPGAGSATASPSGTGGTPTRSGTGSPPASGTASAAPGGTAEAEAREVVSDRKGFAVAVPTGWTREEAGSVVFYRSPDRAALIQVFRVTEPELSPLDAVRGASADLRTRTDAFTEIRIGPVPDGSGAAELVYEYDNEESRGRRRGVERVLLAPDGRTKWAVLTAGPASEWTLTQARHAAALRAFRPADTP
ncbi:serine/arginine repetitive matrix protein 2, partial [Streptomyces bambusae]|nr:serine/arginine repetitive matrix protein 2 [Streptomyces bambusae]